MSEAALSCTTDIRVRYADTDQMKFAYYGKFFEYFEQGRADLLRLIGMPYTEVEAMGIYLPVIEASAKYKRSARYDDLLHVETTIKEMPIARVRIEYRVFRHREIEPIAEGFTVHSFVNAHTAKPTRAPARFLEALDRAFKEMKSNGGVDDKPRTH
jgi:acyl-CoA thioester hydrolase